MPIVYVNPAPRRRRRKQEGHGMITKKRRKKTTKAKTTLRRRKRRNPAARKRRTVRAAAPMRRRKRRNPAARKRRTVRAAAPMRRRYRRNPRATSPKSLARARRAIRHAKKTPQAKAFMRRYRMQSNPNGIMDSVKMVLPFGASLYGSRFVTGMLQKHVMPMTPLAMLRTDLHRPFAAAAVMAGMHFASKRVGALKKHASAVMVGAGLNMLDSILAAFAPTSVKAMLGVGDIYDSAMGEYLEVGDYVQIGNAPPIDDDITLADYVEVGLDEELGMGVEEELGLEAELGLEQELGSDPLSRPLLGGVSRGSMLAPIKSVPMLAPIPARSFTKKIPRAGAGYDKRSVLYGGIFAGGW